MYAERGPHESSRTNTVLIGNSLFTLALVRLRPTNERQDGPASPLPGQLPSDELLRADWPMTFILPLNHIIQISKPVVSEIFCVPSP